MSVPVYKDTFGQYIERNRQDQNYFTELTIVLKCYFRYFYNLLYSRTSLAIGPVEVYEVSICGFHVANQILFSHDFLSEAKRNDLSFLAAAILFAALGHYIENQRITAKQFYIKAVLQEHKSTKTYQSTWEDLIPLINQFCPSFSLRQEMAQYENMKKQIETQNHKDLSDEQKSQLLYNVLDGRLKEFAQNISKMLRNNTLENEIMKVYQLAIQNEMAQTTKEFRQHKKSTIQRNNKWIPYQVEADLYQNRVNAWRKNPTEELTDDEKERLALASKKQENLQWAQNQKMRDFYHAFEALDENNQTNWIQRAKQGNDMFDNAQKLIQRYLYKQREPRRKINEEILKMTQ